MKRRDLIKNSLFAIPAGLSIGAFMEACKKIETSLPASLESEQKFESNNSICIIGAGAAGLYAAYLLNKMGYSNLIILEASGTHGGRIRKLSGFADFDIELGAEEVHGQRSTWHDIVIKEGGQLVNDNGSEDYYFIDNKLKPGTQLRNDADLNAANKVENSINNKPPAYFPDVNAAAYIKQQQITNRVKGVLDATIGSEYGSSTKRIGVKPLAEGNQLWNSGDINYLCTDKTYIDILNSKCVSVLGKIKYNAAVKSIDSTGNQVVITDTNNETYSADRVVVTVPLPVLKSGDIIFTPVLPGSKINAFAKLGMDAGMKIMLKFSKQIWNNDTGSIYGNGSGPVPEFWATGWKKTKNNVILTSFVMGEPAEMLSSLGASAVDTVVAQLDKMFGHQLASKNLQSSYIMDWYKEPYIRGAYSYPQPGSNNADRKALAQNIGNRIFFAGEATNVNGMFATVHGAIESAERVVGEVKDSL